MKVDTEIFTLRGGALFISIVTTVLALPPALLAIAFLFNFKFSSFYHTYFFALTIGSVLWAVSAGIFCQIRPSKNCYFMVLSSLALMMICWGAWWKLMPRGIIH